MSCMPSRRARRVGVPSALVCLAMTGGTQASAHVERVAHPRSHGVDLASVSLRRHAPRAATASADRWCGVERSSDDTRNQVANGEYRFHAIYLVPQASPDRFGALASQIQADAFGASALLERLYGRALRFDMGTNCGADNLDISVVRTPLSSTSFSRAARHADGTLDLVASALSAAGFPNLKLGQSKQAASRLTTNYVVWLDAPVAEGTCGTAQVYDDPSRSRANWNNYGGKVAVVFRSGSGFCGEGAVRHEIGHTLGAVQSVAPNASDGGHCDDAYEDTMCDSTAPIRAGGSFENEFFDYGNDDYWDPVGGPALRWWTVNLSRFVCPDAACNHGTLSARPRSSRATFRRVTQRRRSGRTSARRSLSRG